jgi:hypothetical protein
VAASQAVTGSGFNNKAFAARGVWLMHIGVFSDEASVLKTLDTYARSLL